MAQDGDYYLKTMNEEFNKTFGAKESFTAFLTTLFKEKMFTHAIVKKIIIIIHTLVQSHLFYCCSSSFTPKGNHQLL